MELDTITAENHQWQQPTTYKAEQKTNNLNNKSSFPINSPAENKTQNKL